MTRLRNNPKCSTMFTWLLYVTTASVLRAHDVSHASSDCSASSIRPQSAPSAPAQDNVVECVGCTCFGCTSLLHTQHVKRISIECSHNRPRRVHDWAVSHGAAEWGTGGEAVNVSTHGRYLVIRWTPPAASSSGGDYVRRDASFPCRNVLDIHCPRLQPAQSEHEPRTNWRTPWQHTCTAARPSPVHVQPDPTAARPALSHSPRAH